MRRSIRYAAVIVPVLGIAILSTSGAFAFGVGGWGQQDPADVAQRQQAMFEHQATMLGIGVDDIKNAWAEGKTTKDLIDEYGIDEEALRARMQAQHRQQFQERLTILVEQGVITQEQANERTQSMQTMQENRGERRGDEGAEKRGMAPMRGGWHMD